MMTTQTKPSKIMAFSDITSGKAFFLAAWIGLAAALSALPASGGELTPIAPAECAVNSVEILSKTSTSGAAKARFTIEVADTDASRTKGLMFRREMPYGQGMLFVYPAPQAVSFWMKNTFIPLDLIFTDQRGVITRIHEHAVPHDLTPIPGGSEVLTVLEINAGLTRAMGIHTGDVLRHLVFKGNSIAPCKNDKN